MAAKPLHAFDYLAQPGKHPPRPVCALFGDDAFLRRQSLLALREAVLGGEDAELSFTAFAGREAEWRDVREELATLAMFGGGQRLVAVEEADDFVTRYRPQLEDYAARPVHSGVLVLDLKTFPSNTRLYKAVAAEGLLVDCAMPPAARLTRWLGEWARQAHQFELPQAAAEMLVEIVGPEAGLLHQELAKLALLAGPKGRATPELVRQSVGGWRAKTAWVMLDAALDGDLPTAMRQLDRLLAAGEQPLGILAQISASLRRFAAATRLVLQAEAAGRRIALPQALEQAGIRSFAVQKAQRQLKRLGRHRGARLYRWMLEADLAMKGDSSLPPRMVIERLILRLAVEG